MTTTAPPPALTPDFDAIETNLWELVALPQWVVFKLVDKGKKRSDGTPKPDKIPYDACTGSAASHSGSSTWSTYLRAVATYKRGGFAGLGFVFSGDDPYVGVDLDGACRNPDTGAIAPWAQEIIDRLDSYTEVSPSGTGVHIIVRGNLPPGGRKGTRVEMYETNRFFTMTGKVIEVRDDHS